MAVAFRHDAGIYAGADEFVGLATSFLDRALDAGEPVLVLVDTDKASRLRSVLGERATVVYGDVRAVGRNPAHLIPAWAAFVEANAGATALWGIGEPLWPERSPSELAECHQHEALLNVALAGDTTMSLLCPIDHGSLATDVVAASVQCHPSLRDVRGTADNADYRPVDAVALLNEPLPPPPVDADTFAFTASDLPELRRRVGGLAASAGFDADRAAEIVLAVDEVATNSYRHGGGEGTLVSWREDDRLVCEVRDAGRFTDPMVGRRIPPSSQVGGRGLWIANQLCDVVQVRSSDAGAVVRMHARPGA